MTNSSNAIQGTSYNAAGQPTSLTYSGYGETRTYNSLNQLTGISVSAANVNLAYIYPAGTNNGQITSMTDGPSTVSYGYDALKRLTSASATGGTAWSQTFGYDGFGNLDSKSGSSAWTASISATTNRVNGYCYDSNGNMLASNTNCGAPMYTYDIQNRITGGLATGSGSGSVYLYNTANKRVAVIDGNGNETVYFYGVRGEKLMTMPLGGANQAVSNVYFGGKLIERMNQYGGQLIWTDRLGSVKNGPAVYLPYGEELTSTANDTEKFGTYTRDAATGLDYADQRFCASTYGRFDTPDPSMDNVDYQNPVSWNAYSYTNGDPINFNDPSGLLTCGDIPGANSGGLTGRTFQQILNTSTDYGLLATTIYVESAGSASSQGSLEMAGIGAVIMNRYNIVNGFTQMGRSNGTYQAAPAAWGNPDGTLASIIINPNQFQVWQGAGGTLTDNAQSRLDNALNSDSNSATCQGLEQAYFTALDDLTDKGKNVLLTDEKTGLAFTGFNSFSYTQKYSWEQYIGQFGSANKFYGVPVPIPVTRRPGPVRPPGRGPHPL